MKPTYDRATIARRAHELRRTKGLSFSDAMRAAWAEAKASNSLPAPAIVAAGARNALAPVNRCAQPSGLSAALLRNGVDVEALSALAARARSAVAHVAEIITDRVEAAALAKMARVEALRLEQRADGRTIDARRGSDGLWNA